MKRNSNIILLVCAIPIILSGCALIESRSEEKRKEREQKLVEGYENIKKIIFSGKYIFEATHMYPAGGYPAKSISGSNYYLEVDIYDVTSVLPFYGTRYLSAIPPESGIRIDGELEDLMIEESDSRKKVLVKFSVKDDSDEYLISLSITSNGDANLTISSAKRSSISYNGKIVQPDPTKEGEKEEGIPAAHQQQASEDA